MSSLLSPTLLPSNYESNKSLVWTQSPPDFLRNTETKINSTNDEVIQKAKTKIKDFDIIDNNIGSKPLKRKVLKKCKEAILQSNDYKQIGKYLVESLNNVKYEWTAFVYQRLSADYFVSSFVYKIKLSFGELDIVLISHLRQSDINPNLSIVNKRRIQELPTSDDYHYLANIDKEIEELLHKNHVEDGEVMEEEEGIPHQMPQAIGGTDRFSWIQDWALDRIIKSLKDSIEGLKTSLRSDNN